MSKIGKMPGETYDPVREGLKPYDYEDYWEAPAKYWRKTPVTDAEMALVEVRSFWSSLRAQMANANLRTEWRSGIGSIMAVRFQSFCMIRRV